MRDLYTKPLAPRARELHNNQTPADRKLWFEFLRTYPVKFRRQVRFRATFWTSTRRR